MLVKLSLIKLFIVIFVKSSQPSSFTILSSLKTEKKLREKKIIIETLKRSKGDKDVTARLLGITPRTIYRKMNSLEEEEKREELNKEELEKEEMRKEEAKRIGLKKEEMRKEEARRRKEEEEANDNINS